MNDLPYWINIIGLCFDIVGVIMLFKYGLPSKVQENADSLSLEESSQKEYNRKGSNKRIICLSYTGIIMLIVGFVIQLLANIIYISCK